MEVYKDGDWNTVTSAEVYANGAWRPVRLGEAYISGAWRVIFSTADELTLSVSPSSVTGSAESSTVTTSNVTATPSGGLAPYTYSWAYTAADVVDYVANSPTSATTNFTASGVASGTAATANFRCTVTDAIGSTATADVGVSCFHFS